MEILVVNSVLEAKKDEPLKLMLIQEGNTASIKIVNGQKDFQWSLVTFSVENGKLVLVRETGVEDSRVLRDNLNAIVEV